MYNIRSKRYKDRKTIAITKDDSVPMQALYDVKDEYKEKEKSLSALYRAEQEKFLEKVDALNLSVKSLDTELTSLKTINKEITFKKNVAEKQIAEYNYYGDINNIMGKWEYKTQLKGEQFVAYVNVTNDSITPMLKTNMKIRKIISYSWSNKEHRIVLISQGVVNEIYLEKLEPSEDFRYLFGTIFTSDGSQEACSYERLSKDQIAVSD